MKIDLVVDSKFGGKLAERLLRNVPEVAVTGAREMSSAIPFTRTLQSRGSRVAAIATTFSTYPEAIDETTAAAYDMGGRFGAPHSMLILAVPEIASALFTSPADLARTLDVEIARDELIRAENVPGPVLDVLIARSPRVNCREEFIDAIDDAYAEQIRRHDIFRRLDDFIAASSALSPPRAAA